MKLFRIITLFAFIIGLIGCAKGRGPEKNGDLQHSIDSSMIAVLEFDTLVNDMGYIEEGEQIISWFDYINTGDAPLVIQDIKAGCGCTVPGWNVEPLQPGEGETIKIVFDSHGKKGVQNIKIAVYSNAKNQVQDLQIKGIVKSTN